MAAELRDTRSGRRKGSSSDISSVREKARIALLRKGSSWAFKLARKQTEEASKMPFRGRAARFGADRAVTASSGVLSAGTSHDEPEHVRR